MKDETFEEVLNFIATGGYSLKAYDRFRRLVPEAGGMWRIARPQIAQQHRLNAGVIVEQPLLTVRFRNGRKLGTIEEGYASTLAPGDHFFFSGLSLEVEQFKDADIIVRASSKQARIVTYGGQRMSMSTHLANRVRHMLCDRNDWHRFPTDVSEWLEVQSERSVLPEPHQLLVETFPHEGHHYMVAYSFEGWNAHQSLGMLITRRMETAGLKPLGFVANDYGLACYGLEPITDPKSLFSPDILEQEFVTWVESSMLLKTAFREVAVIGGLVERHHPGKKKSGRQVSFSTDLIYDVLRRYEPQHLLLRAAWDDARRRMTELGRLVRLVDRASATMLHIEPGPDHADGRAADGHRRARSAPAGRGGRRVAPDAGRRARERGDAGLTVIAASSSICDASTMKRVLLLVLPVLLSGCVVGTVAKAAVDVATLPVKVASAGVDAATTSQSEADEKRGRELRRQDEERGKQARLAQERCRKGRPLATDACAAIAR